MDLDYENARSALRSDGFFFVRGFLNKDELARIQSRLLSRFFTNPWFSGKFSGLNYCTEWIVTDKGETASIRFYENNFNDPVLKKKNDQLISAMETLENFDPNRNKYIGDNPHLFNIFSIYFGETGYYPKHSDANITYDFAPLQTQILLTTPNKDYLGGSLRLHTKAGIVCSNGDLKVHAGDLLFFDKRIEHDVTQCQEVTNGLGRWMCLIGARNDTLAARPSIIDRLKNLRNLSRVRSIRRRLEHLQESQQTTRAS